jgi:tetratricopeptide (TPR) repeat protein
LLDRQEEALPHYEQAARLSPEDPVRHLNLAVDLAECGRLQDAIEEYQAATHLTSDDKIRARTYESLGALFGALGDYAKVHESYRQALQLDLSQADEMVRHLSQSIASQPTSESYLQLGMLLQEMNKLTEARIAYQQALELDPTLKVAKESLAVLQRSDK